MKRFFSFLILCSFALTMTAQQPKPLPGKSGGANNGSSAESIGRTLAQGMFIDRTGYPNLQIRAGYSFWVGPNLSLKAELGKAAGISVEIGIGKKINLDYQTRYLGLGFRGGDGLTDIAFGIKFGQVVDGYFVDISVPDDYNTFSISSWITPISLKIILVLDII